MGVHLKRDFKVLFLAHQVSVKATVKGPPGGSLSHLRLSGAMPMGDTAGSRDLDASGSKENVPISGEAQREWGEL